MAAVPPLPLLKAWCVAEKVLPDTSANLCSHCRKHGNSVSAAPSQPGTHQKIIDMTTNCVGCRGPARTMGVDLNTIFRHLELSPQSVTSRIQPGSDVTVCAEMEEQ